MVLALAAMAAGALALAPLTTAAEVHASVGVNVHIEYTDGGYRDLGAVQRCLSFLGVRSLRDAAPNPRNQGQGGYVTLARAGFRFDLFVDGEPIAAAVDRVARLAKQAPGVVESLEGPNEVNNHRGFSFEGERNGHRAATLYQAQLFSRAKADPALAATPIVNFTDYPATFGQADLANVHTYPPSGEPPQTEIGKSLTSVSETTPDLPIIVTEVGFATSDGGAGVSELAQARLTLMSLLEDARHGVRRTFIYQLLDAYPDTSGSDKEKHYGLFDLQYRPKPAARAVRRFLSVFEDQGAGGPSLGIADERISVRAAPPDLRTLEVRRQDGGVVLAVWRAVRVFDPKTHADAQVTPTAVDLDLPHDQGDVRIVDPVAETEGRVRAGADATRLTVGADPLLITLDRAKVVAGGG